MLIFLKEKYPFNNNESTYNEVIQTTVDFLIYGEKEDNYSIFEYNTNIISHRTFCELNFMGEFLYMFSHSNNRDIILHIIKAFALLILTLTDKRSIYYLFSHNCFNQILNSHFEDYGDDFLSYYVNFIKSLALKIDMTTITFFFYPKTNKFPLLESTLRIYNYPDPMIQNVVKNIFLTCLRLNHELIYKYLCSLPSVTYFCFLACRLRDITISLNSTIIKNDQSCDDNAFYDSKCILDDIVDEILYLQDIFSLKIIQINHILINCLFYYWLLPFIYRGLLQKGDISINLSLLILSVLFYYIKDEQMINMLFIVFFFPEMNESLMKLIEVAPNSPKNYHFDWNLQVKEYNELTFQLHIIYHFTKEYIRSLIKKPYLPYEQITPIVEKYEVHPLFHKKTLEEQYMYIIEDVFKFFSDYDLNEMSMFHQDISTATGVYVGISNIELEDKMKYTILPILTRLINISVDHNEIEEKYTLNKMNKILFDTFSSKESPQSFIGNILLHIILESKIISKELFDSSSFITAKSYYLINNNNIIHHDINSKHILFDNNYFKSLLNESEVKTKGNNSYNSKLLSNLINVC